MYRFVCNSKPSYKIADAKNGRWLEFNHGCLDTDEDGAMLIRSLDIFGRVILEGDPTAPAHGEVPLPVLDALPSRPKPADFNYCPECDRNYISKAALDDHRRRSHGGV